jgi:hypothetical protein
MRCQGWESPCNREDAVKFKMPSSCVDKEDNYAVLCPECRERCLEYWSYIRSMLPGHGA